MAIMKQIYLIITKKCNLDCGFCIRNYDYNVDGVMSVKDVNLLIDRLKNISAETEIVVSGGEPTIHKYFGDILYLLCCNFNKITLNTNGANSYFFKKEFLDIVKNFEIKIQFSIDGNREFHNTIRGEGSYEKTLKNLQMCSRYKNVTVAVSTTVSSKKFIDGFDELYGELLGFFNEWSIKRVSYSGEAARDSFDYLNNCDWNDIVDFVKSKDVCGLIKCNKNFDFLSLDKIDDNHIDALSNKIVNNCGSGRQKIYIYPNLDVLPCTCYESFPSGNLKNNTLEEILLSENHLKVLSQVMDNPACNSCRYKKICNGGCLGSGFYRTGMFNLPDMRCPKVRKESNRVELINLLNIKSGS